MSQKKVDFLKKANIQINKTKSTPADDILVNDARGLLYDIVESGDVITDTEQVVEMVGATLDWHAGEAVNDYIVNVHKGNYAIKQDLTGPLARLRDLTGPLPASITGGDITGSATSWDAFTVNSGGFEYGDYVVYGHQSGKISSYHKINKTWHTYDSDNGGIVNDGNAIGNRYIVNMCSYQGNLLINNGQYIASWDGTAWKNYNGSGEGTGLYSSDWHIGTSNYSMIEFNGMLVIGGSYARLSSYDGTNWKFYDGTGTGTGPYNSSAAVFGGNTSSHIFGAMVIYNNHLVFGAGGGNVDSGAIASIDEFNNWTYFDGTGGGAGPFADPFITSSTNVAITDLYVYSSEGPQILITSSDSGHVASYDGTAWKSYLGVGAGIGPGGVNVTYCNVRKIAEYNGDIVFFGSNKTFNWNSINGFTYSDGTGNGTGFFLEYTNISKSNGSIQGPIIIGSTIIFSSYYGEITSYDGANWKYWDGTGTGTETYTEGLIETTQENIYNGIIYDKKLVVATGTGKISFYDFISDTWYGYNHSHPLCNDGTIFNKETSSSIAMVIYDGNLVVGASIGLIASFDGTAWKNSDGTGTGTGVWNNATAVVKGANSINSMVVFDGDLIVAGNACKLASHNLIGGWTKWDGTGGTGIYNNVTALNGSEIKSMIVFNGDLIIAGSSCRIASCTTAGVWTNYDGTGGTGIYNTSTAILTSDVFAMTIFNGDLIIGGQTSRIASCTTAGVWTNYDGTGGTGIYNSDVLNSNKVVYDLQILGTNLIAVGDYGTGYYDGANWHNVDSKDDLCVVFKEPSSYKSLVHQGILYVFEWRESIECIMPNDDGVSVSIFQNNNSNVSVGVDFIGTSLLPEDIGIGYGVGIETAVEFGDYIVFAHTGGYITSYHVVNKTWHNAHSNNGGIFCTDDFLYPYTVRAMVVFNGDLVLAGKNGKISSVTTANVWTKYDGTGPGTGFYNGGNIVGNYDIYYMKIFNGDLTFITTTSMRVASVTTAGVITDYLGAGGTGIYHSGSTHLPSNDVKGVEVFNGDLIILDNGGHIASVTIANVWTNYDGTGGTGIYNNQVVAGVTTYCLGVYSTFLVVVGASKVGSYDGTNWKNSDGTGTGTGPYTQNILYGANYMAAEYDGDLILAGSAGYVMSYDGTNWKFYNGDGTGTGPYYLDRIMNSESIYSSIVLADQIVFLGKYFGGLANYSASNGWTNYDEPGIGYGIFKEQVYRQSYVQSEEIFATTVFENKIVMLTTSGRVSYYDLTTKEIVSWSSGTLPSTNKGEVGPLGRDFNTCDIIAYEDQLVTLGIYTDNNWHVLVSNYSTADGWSRYDGTGAGIQPYGTLAETYSLTASTNSKIINYNGILVISTDNGDVSSFDGANWKMFNGAGTGTGPYHNSLLGSSHVYSMIEYDGDLIFSGSNGKVASYDGTNWKEHDGTGTGTGIWNNSTVIGTANIKSMVNYNGTLVFAGASSRLGSYDGTNWKNYDGTGVGTGIFNVGGTGSGIGTGEINIIAVYNDMLIIAGTSGYIASWDGTAWKNYDGSGAGTGPYNGTLSSTYYSSEIVESILYLFGQRENIATIDLNTNAINSSIDKNKIYYK